MLDLTAVEFIDATGLWSLYDRRLRVRRSAINAKCARLGLLWPLVAGPAVSRLVSSCGLGLPTSELLTAALASVKNSQFGERRWTVWQGVDDRLPLQDKVIRTSKGYGTCA